MQSDMKILFFIVIRILLLIRLTSKSITEDAATFLILAKAGMVAFAVVHKSVIAINAEIDETFFGSA